MSNIVKRLRDQGKDAFSKQYSLGMWKLCDEAANEIERLQRVIDSRPAINEALPESYVKWSHRIYLMEFEHATGTQS